MLACTCDLHSYMSYVHYVTMHMATPAVHEEYSYVAI